VPSPIEAEILFRVSHPPQTLKKINLPILYIPGKALYLGPP